MTKWLLLACAIVLEVSATLALEAAVTHPAWLVLTVLGYIGSFAALAALLRTGAAIGVIYGIWSAAGVALTAVIAAVLFGEELTVVIGLGILLVIGGVVLVETGSHPDAESAATGTGTRSQGDADAPHTPGAAT